MPDHDINFDKKAAQGDDLDEFEPAMSASLSLIDSPSGIPLRRCDAKSTILHLLQSHQTGLYETPH